MECLLRVQFLLLWDFQRALGEPHEESLRRSFAIAHRVERELSTGLGDVTALAAGGVERRTRAGSPFSGKLLNRGPEILKDGLMKQK